MTSLSRIRHVTTTVSDPDADHGFHVGALGLSLVGESPGAGGVRRFYGAGSADPGQLVSTISIGAGIPPARRGSNAPKVILLSIPSSSLSFWRERLRDNHIATADVRQLGRERITFAHPDGTEYALVENDADERSHPGSGQVPDEHAIRGLYGVRISLMDVREMTGFLVDLIGAKHETQEDGIGLFVIGDGSPAGAIEVIHEPYTAPALWKYAVGVPHHIAFDVESGAARSRIVDAIRDAGYPDLSPAENGNDFTSVWFRGPGGPLFNLTCPAGAP